jgi:hypothetical protein
MIVPSNPNPPACERCGNYSENNLCGGCEESLEAIGFSENVREFRGAALDWFELQEHRQSVKYLEWVDAAKSAAGMAAE